MSLGRQNVIIKSELSTIWQIVMLICVLLPYTPSNASSHRLHYGHRWLPDQGSANNGLHYVDQRPSSRSLVSDIMNSNEYGSTMPTCSELRILWKESKNLLKNMPNTGSVLTNMISPNTFYVKAILSRLMANHQRYNQLPHSASSFPLSSYSQANSLNPPALGEIVYDSVGGSENEILPPDEAISGGRDDGLLDSGPKDVPGHFENYSLKKDALGPVYGTMIADPDQSHKQQQLRETLSSHAASRGHDRPKVGFGRVITSSEEADDGEEKVSHRSSESLKKDKSPFLPPGIWHQHPVDVSSN